MASYFTVNIALHFLFNWKIEKAKFSPIRLSFSSDGSARKRSSLLTKTRFLARYSYSSVQPDTLLKAFQDGFAKKSEIEKSSCKAVHANNNPNATTTTNNNNMNNQGLLDIGMSSADDLNRNLNFNLNPPALRPSGIIIVKELSDHGAISSAHILPMRSHDTDRSVHYVRMRSGSYEDKQQVDLLNKSAQLNNNYAESKRTRRESTGSIALRPLAEDSQTDLM